MKQKSHDLPSTDLLPKDQHKAVAQPTDGGSPDAARPAAGQDVVLIHGMTEDQKGLKVLRARNDTIEVGEVRPLAEGQPINNDVVRLKPRAGAPYLCDVETQYSPEAARKTARAQTDDIARKQRTGPAQVATKAYRDNWDAIWASQKTNKASELN